MPFGSTIEEKEGKGHEERWEKKKKGEEKEKIQFFIVGGKGEKTVL